MGTICIKCLRCLGALPLMHTAFGCGERSRSIWGACPCELRRTRLGGDFSSRLRPFRQRPAGSFGLPNILSARSPNEKLNVAGIGVGGQGYGDLRNVAATENIVALADVDSARARAGVQDVGQGDEVHRLPQDARQGSQEHRRGRHRHARPHARDGRAGLHAAGQARLCREAAHADAVGSSPADASGGEVQSRHANGQPGLLARCDARGLRDHLVGRDRRSARSPRLDRPGLLAAGHDEGRRAHAGPRHAGLGFVAGRRGAAALHRGRPGVSRLCRRQELARRTRRRRRAASLGSICRSIGAASTTLAPA